MFAYRDYSGVQYRVRRIGPGQAQVGRLVRGTEEVIVDYLESPKDLANLVVGFDRQGRPYRLMKFDTGRRREAQHYVQVFKLDGEPAICRGSRGSLKSVWSLSQVRVDG